MLLDLLRKKNTSSTAVVADPQNTPHSKDTIKALWKITKVVLDTLDFNDVSQKICDSLLSELGYLNLGYRIIVLSLYREDQKSLQRISLSQTSQAQAAVQASTIPFHDILIPIDAKENYCVKAFVEQKHYITHDWKDLLSPPLKPEDARTNQKAAGIKASMIFPVVVKGKSVGTVIFSMVKDYSEVSEMEFDLIKGFTDIVGIAVQNAKLYSELETTSKNLDIANKKLQELDKLKDEFVSLASHELRTPMTAIKGSLSTILEGYAGEISKESREFLAAAYNENDRLIRLVNNLLNISRIEAGRFTFTINKISMSKLINEVVGNLQMSAKEKNLSLTFNQVGVLPMVMADEDKVREVLINLIGNALKFTHKGGVSVAANVKDNMLVISVSDTGSGISREDQDLLFKKFSQVQGSYAKQTGGTGLGLYISKQIIEGLKGSVWLESTLGKGSTFYFSLPVAT